MDLGAFCAQTRVLIVAGKGGVGKTTVSAALAVMAADTGRRVLIVEVEGKSGLGALFGSQEVIGYEPAVLRPAGAGAGDVRARLLTPDDALVEYLETHGLRRVSRRLSSTGTLDLVATGVPGIKDILVLGKVKSLEQGADPADLVIVDAPAAGHAVTFLSSASGLLGAATVGPIRAQAADVVSLLSDPSRCQVLLVTLPEETPVNEAVETAYLLEDRAGVQLAPVVVNGVWPPLALPPDPVAAAAAAEVSLDNAAAAAVRAATAFRRARQDLQAAQITRLAQELPLPQLRLPFLFVPDLGPTDTEVLATCLAGAVEGLTATPSAAGR